jgi:hypothetical protein
MSLCFIAARTNRYDEGRIAGTLLLGVSALEIRCIKVRSRPMFPIPGAFRYARNTSNLAVPSAAGPIERPKSWRTGSGEAVFERSI